MYFWRPWRGTNRSPQLIDGPLTPGQIRDLGETENNLLGWLCKKIALRSEVEIEQEWRVDNRVLGVCWELNEAYSYRLRILSGWPPGPKDTQRHSLLMAETFQIATTGQVRDPRKWTKDGRAYSPETARWKARRLIEAGIVARPNVDLKQLEPDAPEEVVAAWVVIRTLVEVRTLAGDTDPMPLVVAFLIGWSGRALDEPALRRARYWLKGRGYITHVGDGPDNPLGKPMHLFEIATAAST